MNLILLDSDDSGAALPRTDPRAGHILEVLRRSKGDSFDVGFADGRTGKARLEDVGEEFLRFRVIWTGFAPDLHPITLIIGMPRPQTARRLLREMTAMGAGRLYFCDTDRSDPGYARSSLWTGGEYERHLKSGAEQAFNPRLPQLRLFPNLTDAIESLESDCDRVVLDNYEAPKQLSTWLPATKSAVLTLGAERGWSPGERDLLRGNGFTFWHLGARVLRLETAAAAATAIVLSKLDFM